MRNIPLVLELLVLRRQRLKLLNDDFAKVGACSPCGLTTKLSGADGWPRKAAHAYPRPLQRLVMLSFRNNSGNHTHSLPRRFKYTCACSLYARPSRSSSVLEQWSPTELVRHSRGPPK
jgi:hypothetical protein